MTDFEQVYSEYYDIVHKYVSALCKDRALSEEITQDTFFKALKKIDSFRGECKLSVWLCQIAKNTFYTEIKKMQHETTEFPLEAIADSNAPEQYIFDKEEILKLHRLLHALDEPYKEVFWMRTFGELNFREIGAIFKKTESWARVTYYRAKMKIREEIR